MKKLIVFGMLVLLIYICGTLVSFLPFAMMTAPRNTPDKKVLPPANVDIAIGRNYSSGITMDEDPFMDDSVESASLRNSNLQIDLPSGRALFYNTDDYGSVYFTNKIATSISFRLDRTTPHFYESVKNLKIEIAKFRNFAPQSVDEC